MSTALHVSLTSTTTPSLSTESTSVTEEDDFNNHVTTHVATPTPVIREDEFPLQYSAISDVGSGGTGSDVRVDGIVVSSTGTDVDDFLPSCYDVIEHLFRLDDDDPSTGDESVTSHSGPLLTTNDSVRSVGEPEVIRTESMVVSTSSSAMPTALSMQYQYPMGGRTTPTAIGHMTQQNRSAPTESIGNAIGNTSSTTTSDLSGGGIRLPVAPPAAGDMPIVYLLTTPGIRAGSGVPHHGGRAIISTSMGGASFAVVSRDAMVSATTAANGDTRPLLRFMQIAKRPPGGLLPGPVGPLAGIHLVGAQSAGGTGRPTPVFGPVLGPPAVRPPPITTVISSSSPIVGVSSGTVVSGHGGLAIVSLACSQSSINHVVHPSTGGPTGLVRLAAFQPQHLVASTGGFAAMSPSSAAAMFLSRLASAGVSAADMMRLSRPLLNCVNGQTPPTSSPVCTTSSINNISSVVSSTRPRPSRSHHQSVTSSITSVAGSTPSLRAVSGCALTMMTSSLAETMSSSSMSVASGGGSGSRQTVQEKNAYEYERVMDILRYYRELVVERKLPGACLPCKRRKSKPLVSVGPGGVVTGHNDDESSTLPIPPPPPPPPVVSGLTRTPSSVVPSPGSVVSGIVIPATAAVRQLPYITAVAAPSCVNGLRPVGVPLNVRPLAAASIFPPRFIVSAALQMSSSSAPPGGPSGGAMARLVFYTAASSSPALTSSLPVTYSSSLTSGIDIHPSANITANSVTSTIVNDVSTSPSQFSDTMTSGHLEGGRLSPQQDTSWKSDLAKLSSLASLTSSLFALDSSLQQPRPSSVDTVLFRNKTGSTADSDSSPGPTQRCRSMSLSNLDNFNRPTKFASRWPTNDDIFAGDHVTDHVTDMVDRNGDTDSSLSSLMTSRYEQEASDALYRRLRSNGLLINDLDVLDHMTSGGYPMTSGERPSSTGLLVDNSSSSACVMPWSNTTTLPVGPGAPVIHCSGADAQMVTRMARKRHLADNDDVISCDVDETNDSDVTTWPEMGAATSMDGNGCELSEDQPQDFLADLHATFPDTNSMMTAERQSIAVREPGCTPTTMTIVTKWTTSRLAIVGPYQSWT